MAAVVEVYSLELDVEIGEVDDWMLDPLHSSGNLLVT